MEVEGLPADLTLPANVRRDAPCASPHSASCVFGTVPRCGRVSNQLIGRSFHPVVVGPSFASEAERASPIETDNID